MRVYRASPRVSLQRAKANAEGVLAENMPRSSFEGTSALVSQAVYYNGVYLYGGDVVSKIVVWSNNGAPAGGITLARVGIYDSTSFSLLASSSSLTAGFALSAAMAETALSSNYTVPADGYYYLAVLTVGTNPPVLIRSAAASNFFSTNVTGGKMPCAAQTSQADLPNPGTLSVNSTAPLWIAAMGTPAGWG